MPSFEANTNRVNATVFAYNSQKLKTGLFGKKKTKTKTEPQLINTSDVSRGLATGQTSSVPLKQQSSLNYDTPKKPYYPSSLKPLIPLLTILTSRWSGSGSYDRLRNLKVIGAGRCEGFKGVVNLLCFSEFKVLKRLYLYMINGETLSNYVEADENELGMVIIVMRGV